MKRAIDWLIPRGFVTFGQAEGMYYGEPKSEEELEMLAAGRGTLGKSAKRKRGHQLERRINLRLAAERARWQARSTGQVEAGTNRSGGNEEV